MQSVNGDVQLSVTLDTKGIQSDAQKIKKEIERGISVAADTPEIKVDSKSVESANKDVKSLTSTTKNLGKELNKSIEDISSTGIQIDVDQSGVDGILNKLREAVTESEKISNNLSNISSDIDIDVDADNIETAAESISSSTKEFSTASQTMSSSVKDFNVGIEKFSAHVHEFADNISKFSTGAFEISGSQAENLVPVVDEKTIQNAEELKKIEEELEKLEVERLDAVVNLSNARKNENKEEIVEAEKRKAEISTAIENLEKRKSELSSSGVEEQNKLQEAIARLDNERFTLLSRLAKLKNEGNAEAIEAAQKQLDEITAEYNKIQEKLGGVIIREQYYTEPTKKPEEESTKEEEKNTEEEITENKEKQNELTKAQAGEEKKVGENLKQVSAEQKEIVADTEAYKNAIEGAKVTATQLARDLQMFNEGMMYSEEFKEMQSMSEILSSNLEKVNKKLAEMEILGERDSEKYQELAEKAEEWSNALNATQGTMADMRQSGEAYTSGSNPEELARVEKQYDLITNKTALLQKRMQELSEESEDFSETTNSSSFYSGFENLENIVTIVKNNMQEFGTIVKTSVGNAIRSLNQRFTRLLGNFKNFVKHLSSSNKHLGIGLKQILGYAIGIHSLFDIFRKLKGMLTEGTKNLIMWHNGSNRANEAISNLTSSLTFLKNAWGAAFEPILSYIAPLLDTFIQKLADVANAISYMLAKLTGQSTWYKAIRVQKDYAKSLFNTGKSAKDAEGKLASYDKLVMVQKDKGSGGGTDGMFEELPIETAVESVDDFLDKLKDAWINADFTDVGNAIGLKLKDALDNIPWDYIKESARKIAHSLATLLNGFFETEGLATSIGKTIAEAFNTVFSFIDEFVHTLHWDSIGKFIAESLFSFVYTFDAETAGSAVGGTIRGVIESLYTMLDTFAEEGGFELIGEKIATFLLTGLEEMSNVRESGLTGWEELGESITIAVDGLITSITTVIQKMSEGDGWYDLGKGIAQLCSKIDFTKFVDDLNELADSIIKAIGEALKGVGDTSPLSTAIAAVIAGLVIAVDTVTLLIMSATAVIGFDVGKIIGDAITGGEDSMWYQEFSWSELFNENDFEDIVNGMILMLDELADAVLHPKNAFELLGAIILMPVSMAMLAYDTIRRLFSGELWDHIKMRLEETTYWWKITFSEIGDKLKKFVDETVYWWKNLFTSIFNTLTEKWGDIGGTLSIIKTKVVTGLTFFKSTVINIFSNLATAIKNPLNSMISSVESFVNYLIQGINSAIKALNSVDFDVPDWVPEIGGQSFGLDIPSLSKITLPRLAQGAIIPPNKEFMAVLGDQKSGVNIETPLKTMMDAFRQVLSETGGVGGNNNQPIVLQLNGRVLAQAVWDEERKKYRQTSSYSY